MCLCVYLEHKAVVELRVATPASGPGLVSATVVREKSQFCQCVVTIETCWQVSQAEQRDIKLFVVMAIGH